MWSTILHWQADQADFRKKGLVDIYVLHKLSKHRTINGEYCVYKLNYRYFGNPVMHGQIWLIFERKKVSWISTSCLSLINIG